jgi:DNA-binding NarL/FixJ family response regulator
MQTVKQNITKLNVLIVDDHKMIRDGLKGMLQSLKKTVVCKVTEATSCLEALHKMEQQGFDLLIMDYRMPGLSGADAVHRMIRFRPETKILVLSNYDEFAYVQSMMEAGARGYVLKSIEPAELLNAIITILDGQIYFCSEVAIKYIESITGSAAENIQIRHALTRRQQEILRLIAMEYTNDEIAAKLFLAKRTIDSHRQNMLRKLDVKNTVGLVKAAYALNLVGEGKGK